MRSIKSCFKAQLQITTADQVELHYITADNLDQQCSPLIRFLTNGKAQSRTH